MHLLFVALSFPSPELPHRSPFIKEQVRLLCECEQVSRITVLSPTTYVPAKFMRRFRRASAQAILPRRYELVENRCEVLFPRYIKAPGSFLLNWTIIQWCRIVERTVARFIKTNPVSLIHANAGERQLLGCYFYCAKISSSLCDDLSGERSPRHPRSA